MEHRSLTLGLFLSTAAAAGPVHFETDAAARVVYGGTTIARAPGPGTLTLGEFPNGPVDLEIHPETGTPIQVNLTVPIDDDLVVRMAKNTITTSNGHLQQGELPAPALGFRTDNGEAFSVIINGKMHHELTDQLMVDSLSTGRHTIEIRSPNKLIVWARGTVDLLAGETVILRVSEGRMVVADGLSNAWTPHPGDTR